MTITIQGQGSFEIPNEKLPELITWLEANSVKLEQNGSTFNGQTLIQEQFQFNY